MPAVQPAISGQCVCSICLCNGFIENRKFGAPTASRWRWVGSSRLCKLNERFWLLSSHVVFNMAYEGDVCDWLNIEACGVYLIGTGRYLGESSGISPAKYGVIPSTEGRMDTNWGDWVWEFNKNQILNGGMLIDTETGRSKDTLVEQGIWVKKSEVGNQLYLVGRYWKPN